jgi:hypothetical protein
MNVNLLTVLALGAGSAAAVWMGATAQRQIDQFKGRATGPDIPRTFSDDAWLAQEERRRNKAFLIAGALGAGALIIYQREPSGYGGALAGGALLTAAAAFELPEMGVGI